MSEQPPPLQFVDLHEVTRRTSLKKSYIYRLMSSAAFPRPVRIGKSVRWVLAEIDAWLHERVSERAS